MREKLFELGYPENIKELIEDAEGVSLIKEREDCFEIWDDYEDNDRFLQINKTPKLTPNMIETFNHDEVDKDKVITFCKTLPPILFMNLKKIYFVKTEDDLTKMADEEESPNHTFCMGGSSKAIGMAVYNDGTAIVNIAGHLKLAKEEYDDDLNTIGFAKDIKSYFEDGIYQTLAHELFHLAQQNPLIEAHIPIGEDVAEEFCRDVISS